MAKSLDEILMVTSIFYWSGPYFGFINDGYLFTADGYYYGWVENDGTVWRADGVYLGELVDDHYVLRNLEGFEPPLPMTPKRPPDLPVPPVPPQARVGKTPRIGWQDPLV
jgi:hypothetical protein